MSTSGMHRRPFEGRHLVFFFVLIYYDRLMLSVFYSPIFTRLTHTSSIFFIK